MIIFQLFAQNEELFRKEGYLSKEGRVRFFTNPDYDGMRWKTLTFSTFIPSTKN